jgi:hypothetical protein
VRAIPTAKRGQAAVETAVVLPSLVFFILGTLQFALMHQARLMLEYAAFSAARAGAVWNADRKIMTDAAIFALVPTFGLSSSQATGSGPIHGAEDLGSFEKTYGAFISAQGLLGAARPLVRVDVLNPTQESLAGAEEVDFDDPAQRIQTQLTIRVAYLYNLRIPYANWMIWQSFMGANAAIEFTRKVDGWYQGATQVPDLRTRLSMLSAATASHCAYTGLTTSDYRALVVAAQTGLYLLPMVTTYTLRMQSNPLNRHLQKRSEVFPGC